MIFGILGFWDPLIVFSHFFLVFLDFAQKQWFWTPKIMDFEQKSMKNRAMSHKIAEKKKSPEPICLFLP